MLLRDLRVVYALFAACLVLGTACKSPHLPARFLARSPASAPLAHTATIEPQAPTPECSAANEVAPNATGSLMPKSEQSSSPQSSGPIVAIEPELSIQSQSTATNFHVPAIPFAFKADTAPTAATSLISTSAEPTSARQNLSSELESSATSAKPAVRLVIAGVRPERGSVKVAIYTTENTFPSPSNASQRFELDATQATIETSFSMPCRFAVGVYQDINADGELNRNRLGIPIEPFAFSNNAMGRRGPPSFDQAAVFADGHTPLIVSINLP